jgi:dihydrofolate reductase
MIISFIAAVSENDVIGNGGQLPWSLPADLRYFKNTTWALPVIMGRKTFESFPKALQGRTNVVITRQEEYSAAGAIVVKNLEEAIARAADLQTKEIFIIGGGEIYRQAWPQANRLYITRVHTRVEGDAFFPRLNDKEWHLLAQRHFTKDEKNLFDYSFEIWERTQTI